MPDVLFLLFSQKSFSLVLDALDHDNDTSESGKTGIYVFVYVFVLLYPRRMGKEQINLNNRHDPQKEVEKVDVFNLYDSVCF